MLQCGAGQPVPPHRLKPLSGPISHPEKVCSKYWVLKVTAGIAKSATTPAHVTNPYTVGLTKGFHSPHSKPPDRPPNLISRPAA